MRWFKNCTRCDEVNTLLQGLSLQSPSLSLCCHLRNRSPPLPPANPHNFDEPADLVCQACVRGSTSTPLPASGATTRKCCFSTTTPLATAPHKYSANKCSSATTPHKCSSTTAPHFYCFSASCWRKAVGTCTPSSLKEAARLSRTMCHHHFQQQQQQPFFSTPLTYKYISSNITFPTATVSNYYFLQEITTLSTVGLAIVHRLTLECLSPGQFYSWLIYNS